jgi:hypothetical protein
MAQCQSKWICELLDVKCNAQTIPGENVSLPVYGDLSDLYHPFLPYLNPLQIWRFANSLMWWVVYIVHTYMCTGVLSLFCCIFCLCGKDPNLSAELFCRRDIVQSSNWCVAETQTMHCYLGWFCWFGGYYNMKYTKEDLQVILLEFHQPSVFFQHPHMLAIYRFSFLYQDL